MRSLPVDLDLCARPRSVHCLLACLLAHSISSSSRCARAACTIVCMDTHAGASGPVRASGRYGYLYLSQTCPMLIALIFVEAPPAALLYIGYMPEPFCEENPVFFFAFILIRHWASRAASMPHPCIIRARGMITVNLQVDCWVRMHTVMLVLFFCSYLSVDYFFVFLGSPACMINYKVRMSDSSG